MDADTSSQRLRRSRWRLVAAVVAALVIVIAAFIGRTLWAAGAFRTIEPHFDGTCRLIEGPVGAEDLTINHRTGRAYISAADRRASMAGQPVPGAIWAYDLTKPDAKPINLTPDAGIDFQPHGISLWVQPDGTETLFIINHPASPNGPRHTVEIADVRGDRLQRRTVLTDSRLVMPNDIVATGPDRFYLTNTHDNPPGFAQTLETYLQLRGAKVLSYGPEGFGVAVDRLVFPNGINVSADGRTIYIAAMTWQAVLVYDRDPATGALTQRDQIPIGSGGDNIEVEPDGTLWIGSHPKLLDVARYAEDPGAPAPSQVLRIAPGVKRAEEVYLSDGKPLAAASVGARYGNRLLIGQIFGAGILDCEMKQG